jgi:hypothetical protein
MQCENYSFKVCLGALCCFGKDHSLHFRKYIVGLLILILVRWRQADVMQTTSPAVQHVHGSCSASFNFIVLLCLMYVPVYFVTVYVSSMFLPVALMPSDSSGLTLPKRSTREWQLMFDQLSISVKHDRVAHLIETTLD